MPSSPSEAGASSAGRREITSGNIRLHRQTCTVEPRLASSRQLVCLQEFHSIWGRSRSSAAPPWWRVWFASAFKADRDHFILKPLTQGHCKVCLGDMYWLMFLMLIASIFPCVPSLLPSLGPLGSILKALVV